MRAGIATLALLLLSRPALAHDRGTAALSVVVGDGVLTLELHAPALPPTRDLEGLLPLVPGCADSTPHASRCAPPACRRVLRCGGPPEVLVVPARAETLLLTVRAAGAPTDSPHTEVLPPAGAQTQVPLRRAAVLGGFGSALVAGVVHVSSGLDHLAFLFVLVAAVARSRAGRDARATRLRSTLVLATLFTAGHTCSVVLAARGLLALPPGPVELAIALSIAVAAADAGPAGGRGWLVLAFGLVHGLGFAGALRPSAGAALTTLAGLNLGVELAQLGFVVALLAAGGLLGRLLPPPWARRGLGLAVEALGAWAGYLVFARGLDGWS